MRKEPNDSNPLHDATETIATRLFLSICTDRMRNFRPFRGTAVLPPFISSSRLQTHSNHHMLPFYEQVSSKSPTYVRCCALCLQTKFAHAAMPQSRPLLLNPGSSLCARKVTMISEVPGLHQTSTFFIVVCGFFMFFHLSLSVWGGGWGGGG